MTQQYILGQLSSLLGELEPAPAAWLGAVHDLRREVESSCVPELPPLAQQAIELTDAICLTDLEQGDVDGFRRCANTAVALREFSAAARLLL